MTFPISGFVQFFGFVALLSFATRAFFAASKEKNKEGLFLAFGFLFLSLSRLLLAFPFLLFLKNQSFWYLFEISERFFLLLGFSFIGYEVFYSTRLKKHIRKIIFLFLFICLIIMIDFAFSPPFYFFRENGILDWKNPPLLASILNFLFILTISVSGIVIFLRNFLHANSKKVKTRSLILSLVFLWSIFPAIFDFFAVPIFHLTPLISEINYFVCYFLILVTLISGYFLKEY